MPSKRLPASYIPLKGARGVGSHVQRTCVHASIILEGASISPPSEIHILFGGYCGEGLPHLTEREAGARVSADSFKSVSFVRKDVLCSGLIETSFRYPPFLPFPASFCPGRQAGFPVFFSEGVIYKALISSPVSLCKLLIMCLI
jgi:hypothetical protein